MKNKHATLIALTVVLTLVLMNAAVLPRLLARAQSLPVEEVAEQVVIADGERLPLPEIPEGIEGYELAFSRAMTEQEQQLWDDAAAQIMGEDTSAEHAEMILTPRAYEQLECSFRYTQIKEEDMEKKLSRYKKGVAQGGEFQIDLGTVTVVLPNDLDKETAIRLQTNLYRKPSIRKLMNSDVDSLYELIFSGYMWMEPFDLGTLHLTRGIYVEESERFAGLYGRYRFEGLRSAGPPLLTEPQGDGMWFDEAQNTVHMPKSHQLTDQEVLQLFDLQVMMDTKAIVDRSEMLISESEARIKALALLQQLFPFDPSDYNVNVSLQKWDFSNNGKPIWNILFQSIQNPVHTNGEMGIILNAADGSLLGAAREMQDGAQGGSAVTERQKNAWRDAAQTFVQPLLSHGVSIVGVQYNRSDYLGDDENSGLRSTDWIVNLSSGADYQVAVVVDGRVSSIRYWPDGCKDNG